MANVILENVSKRFPNGAVAVDQLNLQIGDGEFLVIVGPSGCGKSTTLRLIAGLETPTSGEVKIGNRVVTHEAPKDRDIAMVFQGHALYPHLSVYRNMSFGLSLRNRLGTFGGGVLARGLRKTFQPQRAAELNRLQSEIDNKVQQTAKKLGIEKLLNRKPHQLSGGERQRVALGRAIVRNPAAFLLDEPLSNLDTKLRQQMRVELKRLHRELQTTTVYVTHDQVEAMTLGDRVAVMNDGRILQVGKPLEIYQRPANLFVAELMGNTPINLWRGTVTRSDSLIRFKHQRNGVEIEWPLGLPCFETLEKRFGNGGLTGDVVLGFRAQDIEIGQRPGAFVVEVTQADHLGDSVIVEGQISGAARETSDDNLKHDHHRKVWVKCDSDTNLELGSQVMLTITPNRLMWFDPETGNNLVRD